MGIFCLKAELKKLTKKDNDSDSDNDNDNNHENENEKEDLNEIEYKDLSQKRKLAEYLISSDYNIFKRHLSEVQNLNDEQFNELFEGNTDYKKFNVQNQKNFNQLVAKFDDNKDLIMKWYNKEDYYIFILEIWKPNIFFSN